MAVATVATKPPPAVRSRTEARGQRPLPADRKRSARPLDRLLLDGRAATLQIGDRLVDAQLERTIEGPNTLTLTCWDADRALMQSAAIGGRTLSRVLRVELDGLGFIANGVSKSGNQVAIACEDEVVTTLKRHGKHQPLRFSRGKWTRAHACATMIRQGGVPVIVLDELVIQPIAGRKKLATELAKAKAEARKTTSGTSVPTRSAAKGVPGNLTIKGARATREQARNVAKALTQADSDKATERAILAMLVGGIAEGQFVTARTNAAGSGAQGPWQIMAKTAKALGISATDVAKGAHAFNVTGFRGDGQGAIKLARAHKDWTPGQIADQVEGGGAGEHFYQQWIDEARAWLKAAHGGKLQVAGSAWVKQFAFERRKDESTWAACWRLLVDEVHWRLFVREGVVIIASDPALMRATASIEVSEHSDAVDTLDFDWHRALRVGEMTVQAYVDRWTADPGEVANVTDLPADQGRWLIAAVSEPLFSTRPNAQITLRSPQDPLPEPASSVSSSQAVGTNGSPGSGGGDLYRQAKRISDASPPYVYGGGHGPPLSSIASGDGTDCSSSVSLALFRAGLFEDRTRAIVSGDFASQYGKPGRGKNFTVWANADHVWIEFHGEPAARFDTSPHGDGPPGARVRKSSRSTAGFTARHLSGH